jgi:hypothetical protein
MSDDLASRYYLEFACAFIRGCLTRARRGLQSIPPPSNLSNISTDGCC